MKYLKLYESFNKELKNHLIDDKYLYHYTLQWNLDDILNDGLIPNKNINYDEGTNGVFMTNKNSLYSANLPQRLMDEQNEFYESHEDENYDENEKPIIKLTIDISKLDEELFYPDDDYLKNSYNYNKAKSFDEQLIESLEIWGSISYRGIIDPKYIVSYDFKYFA